MRSLEERTHAEKKSKFPLRIGLEIRFARERKNKSLYLYLCVGGPAEAKGTGSTVGVSRERKQ